MGTIATFNPAKTPQNQQWFQLPVNEMYKVLSDTQTRSDIIKAEAESMAETTFNNIPEDDITAEEKRKWLQSSVDNLSEQYGDDPLKWSAGLKALKKEVRREFDPTTGTIGKMQARYDQVVARNKKLDEDYKDNPLVRDYLKTNYTVTPLSGDPNQVDWGINPGAEYRDVPEKEINDWLNTNLDNIEETTLKRFGLSKYANLNDYTEAYYSGEVTGIAPETVIEYLVGQVPAEYMYSYYQKANAFGSKNAAEELSLVAKNDKGEIAVDNGYYGLNPNSTLAQKIFGASKGKSYEKHDDKYITITDELLKDDIRKKADLAAKQQKASFLGWQTQGQAYQTASPWGTTEASVGNYVSTLDKQNDAFAADILEKVVDPRIISDISGDALASALMDDSKLYTLEGNPILKVQGRSGAIHIVDDITPEAWMDFKGKYDYNHLMQSLAQEDLAEAQAGAKQYIQDNYGKDINALMADRTSTLQKPKNGVSFTEAYQALSDFDAIKIQGSKGGPRYLNSKTGEYVSQEEWKALEQKVSALGLSQSDKNAYKNAGADIDNLIGVYNKQLESQLSPNVAYSTLYTDDYGVSPEMNEVIKKQLMTEFDFTNASNFLAYAVGQKDKMQLKTAIDQAASSAKLSGSIKVEVAGVKKAMSPNPDGVFNWQVNYKVSGKEGTPITVSVLIPEGEGGLQSPTLMSLNQSPYSKAAKATTLAKMFNLTEFTLPDLPHVKLQTTKSGDFVFINGVKTTPEAAVSTLATEYAIRDIMAIQGVDYQTATTIYTNMYGANYDASINAPQPMPATETQQ